MILLTMANVENELYPQNKGVSEYFFLVLAHLDCLDKGPLNELLLVLLFQKRTFKELSGTRFLLSVCCYYH